MEYWVGRWVEMSGIASAALTRRFLKGKKHNPRGPSLAPSLLEAHAPRPPLGAFAWRRLLPALLASARAWVHWAFNAPELLGYPRGQKSSRRPLGRWRLPRAHFKNHFETAPLPFTSAQTAEPPGAQFPQTLEGNPHPSGAPYKKPIPNSRFFGVAQRPDTPLFQAPTPSRYFR